MPLARSDSSWCLSVMLMLLHIACPVRVFHREVREKCNRGKEEWINSVNRVDGFRYARVALPLACPGSWCVPGTLCKGVKTKFNVMGRNKLRSTSCLIVLTSKTCKN